MHSVIQTLTSPKLFPVLMMILNAAAAVRYGVAGQYGQVVYWGAAFLLNFAITFMMPGSK